MSTENVRAEDVVLARNETVSDNPLAASGNPYLAMFRPYIPSGANLRELSILPLIIGTLLGIVFGASSLYLVLKVGLTVSASIPVAVISITLFRLLSKFGMRDATILENNIVQTAGSAGESIAFGLGVTMPAILILGFDLELTRVMLVAVLGGLLGILMMIPLRRALIVQQHGYLKYPEGTACAEVLKAGVDAESRAAHGTTTAELDAEADEAARAGGKTIFAGFGIGFVYYLVQQVLKTWKEYPTKVFGRPYDSASISLENNPALLGVGYIIGYRVSGIMMAGGVLSFMILIPMIKFFGSALAAPLAPETAKLISEMSVSQIQKAYVLYIGAGAVAAGGIISLVRSLPTIWSGLKGGLADLRGSQSVDQSRVPRIDRDLSMKYVVVGIVGLVLVIWFAPALRMNLVGAIMIVALGFLFVTVSSRLTGEIGSSSNPISGMTVATLLLTCLVFLLVGWTARDPYFVTALSVGGIVCIAASNGGTTSQDLKTGFLVGATPSKQQIAILVGALASALVLGPILMKLNQSSTVYVPIANNADFAFAPDYRFDLSQCEQGGSKRESLNGSFGSTDAGAYIICHKLDTAGAPKGRYLVNDQGIPIYLADPGINGAYDKIPGTETTVPKYSAPKATLMSYIIQGILSRQLPWGLVLLGVMIAVVLELSGIPSLAFAVGVYLPISTSAPIFVGGMVRYGVDKYLERKFASRNLTPEEFAAETDKSQGVLLASGYIAGAALAGVIIAFLAGGLAEKLAAIEETMAHSNPLWREGSGDLLSLIPFIVMAVVLYLVGREKLLAPRAR